jgi:outer membrane protein OmpA-like peptidoglycan-associated protein/tetratricopeptide (TPR) repeat protein
MSKRWFSVILIIGCAVLAEAQSTNVSTLFKNNKKKADYFYSHFAYRNALEIYLHIIEKNPDDVHARMRIAECYYFMHEPFEAEIWVEPLLDRDDIDHIVHYLHAEALTMSGRYLQAIRSYERYLTFEPDDQRAIDKISFLNNVNYYMKDSLRFMMENVAFNSEFSDFGMTFFRDDFVFISTRDMNLFVKHLHMDALHEDETLLDMFIVSGKKGNYQEPQHFQKESLKSKHHDGPIFFYDDFKKAIFTRSNVHKGKAVLDDFGRTQLKMYFADVDEAGNLNNIQPFEYNSDHYSVGLGVVSPDGQRLYFSSTAPGEGGADIFYCTKEGNKWSAPINAGKGVNTAGDELYPFMLDNTTLYFSSDGHGSLGGLDILLSSWKEGAFQKAQNIGWPVNSSFDDFAIVVDDSGRRGYLSSNRPGGKGLDDIYYFISTYYYLTGKAMDYFDKNKYIENAKIFVFDDLTGLLVDSVMTDSVGYFSLKLPYDKDYRISVQKDGYDLLDDIDLATHGRPMGIDSLMIPLWSQGLFAKGRIFDKQTEQPLDGVTARLFDNTRDTADTLFLKDRSDYEFLVRPERNYRLEFSKPGYITQGFDLDTKGLIRGDLLNDVLLEEDYVSKEVIYFDFDKSVVKSDMIPMLEAILATMKRFPNAHLHIGAHADSRGKLDYNQRLSERRAAATVNYFTSKGIARKRITSKGFGEELLLNSCSKGVVCEEKDHAVNRRAEIRVQVNGE